MATPTHNIESEALALPVEVRARLAVKLLDSIEQQPSADPRQIERAWLEEANRRYQAFVRGEMEAIPAEQVFAELRAEDR
ncbi:MAG: addiction module protein [Nevskiales bacterium]